MAKIKLNKSYSSFSPDRTINRADQVRRDTDTIKTPTCTIYDIDYAIISYLREIIHPQVEEDGQTIDVPVMFANGEKWSMVQKHGYMRDVKGKLMTPLIFIKRNNIVERDSLKKLDVNINPPGNALTFKNRYTKINKYDRFNVLQGKKPSEEYYISSIPEYVDVAYDLLIWTEYTEQLNKIIEDIMPTGGFAWGTTWKFPTNIGDYGFETMNNTGEDRIVRATLPITTHGTLLFESELSHTTFKKQYSVKKINFKTETQTFNADVDNPPPGGYDKTTKPSPILDRYDPGNTNQTRRRITDPALAQNQRHINKKRYS
jgi:glutaredoxin